MPSDSWGALFIAAAIAGRAWDQWLKLCLGLIKFLISCLKVECYCGWNRAIYYQFA